MSKRIDVNRTVAVQTKSRQAAENVRSQFISQPERRSRDRARTAMILPDAAVEWLC
jgi:hypothetical protein